jgi:hypothetical protein
MRTSKKHPKYSPPLKVRSRRVVANPQTLLLARLKSLAARGTEMTLRSLREEHQISPVLVRSLEDQGLVTIESTVSVSRNPPAFRPLGRKTKFGFNAADGDTNRNAQVSFDPCGKQPRLHRPSTPSIPAIREDDEAPADCEPESSSEPGDNWSFSAPWTH